MCKNKYVHSHLSILFIFKTLHILYIFCNSINMYSSCGITSFLISLHTDTNTQTHTNTHCVNAHSVPCAEEVLMTKRSHAHTRIHWSEISVLIDII